MSRGGYDRKATRDAFIALGVGVFLLVVGVAVAVFAGIDDGTALLGGLIAGVMIPAGGLFIWLSVEIDPLEGE